MGEVRVRFSLINGDVIDSTVAMNGLIELYKRIDMDKMFILTNLRGEFIAAINPRHLCSITVWGKP
jgi:hypothetical protein